MSDFEIRPARSSELPSLTSALGDERFFADRLRRQRAGHGVVLTAWSDGEPIGGVYLWLEPAEELQIRRALPEVPLINRLEVRAGHRNRGVGTMIVRAAEEHLRGLGHRQVALAVEISNIGAARLYRRLGYREWDQPDVVCFAEVTLPDGGADRRPELCRMFVKTLDGEGERVPRSPSGPVRPVPSPG